jgi:hypothetical protein
MLNTYKRKTTVVIYIILNTNGHEINPGLMPHLRKYVRGNETAPALFVPDAAEHAECIQD